MMLFALPEMGSASASVPLVSSLESDFQGAAFSKVAEHESWRKEVHRPATSTHKWWAKRLGSVFRGILVSAVTESGSAALKAYESSTSLAGLTVFDPFAGSGTTVVEAAKLGATAVGWDINPVATLVQRQAVQRWDVERLRSAYKTVEADCRAEIDRVHRTKDGETVLYYFWVAKAPCPACRSDVRLFSNHVFSQHAYPKRVREAQVVCPDCLDVIASVNDFEREVCRNGHHVQRRGAIAGSSMTCRKCGSVSKIVDSLNGMPPRFEMYAKLVLGANGKKRYEPIDDYDKALYDECSLLLQREIEDLVLPSGKLAKGANTNQAMRWGFRDWRQFFNDRQLYSLGLLAKAIRDLSPSGPEREALAALFSGTLEFNNLFCSFKGEGTGAVRHMFSHHVFKPERTPLEAHPWGTPASSGSFSTLFDKRIMRAHDYKKSPRDQIIQGAKIVPVAGLSKPSEATVIQVWPGGARSLPADTVYLQTGDSSKTDIPDSAVDLIITDPPYMDYVHYSELADFFHVWLREIRPHPEYPSASMTTRHLSEVQSTSAIDFEDAITAVWRECFRVLKDAGLMAFTFHQVRPAGWAAIVRSLAKAGFAISAVQAVKGEMSTSVTKTSVDSSNLDAIVVCRKRRALVCPSSRADPAAVAKLAEDQLQELKAGGIAVGPGDVRSLVIAHVLSTFTTSPERDDLEDLEAQADALASECAERLAGRSQTLRGMQ